MLFDFNKDKTQFKCVVCDFGVANLIERPGDSAKAVSGLKIPKTAGFTVRYAAPEVFIKLSKSNSRFNQEIDKKIDVYAFSILLYGLVFRKGKG